MMRRFQPRTPDGLFRGGELARIMTMIGMLIVLVMLMTRARDPSTWSFLTGDGADEQIQPGAPVVERPSTNPKSDEAPSSGTQQAAPEQKEPEKREPETKEPEKPAAERGPTDLDPEEAEASREEYQAITDKAPLSKEDMPAYWRLLQWQKNQSLPELRKRARNDLLFTHFWERPDKYRGQIVKLRLHMVRALTYEPDDTKQGLKRLYEVWGYTDESKPNFYVGLLSEWPKGMPLGANIQEEGTFYGYFFKLMSYKDHLGEMRVSPLIIGKLVWHKTPSQRAQRDDGVWLWVLGGVFLTFIVLRLGLLLLPRLRARSPTLSPVGSAPPADDATVESWLEGGETATPWEGDVSSESEVDPEDQPPWERLDGRDRPER